MYLQCTGNLSVSVALVTVTARFSLDGEWGVASAVVTEEPRNLEPQQSRK